ncbi:DNA glycosylase [Helcococcus ovis]|uniref:DNA-3-methyladenine glycosylase family protein n=1 Tax=Helcococcus ovis TaxID=72026 RepID=UPI0038BD8B45
MKYIIEKKEDYLLIKGLKDFNLTHIFECGQAFRWEKTQDQFYIVIAFGKVIELKHDVNGDLIVFNSSESDFINIWHNYFDLNRDYSKLKNDLKLTRAYSKNDSLKDAMNFGYGIRILNQEKFETIISFIISANNQIPRIKNSIRLLSENYGEFIEEYKGNKYYSFPKAEVLAKADPEEVKEICRVGFRNTRIVDCSEMYIGTPEIFDENLDDLTLGNNLLTVPGIGPKVRDCILLFGYARGETFPVDVWVKRLMETLYIGNTLPNSKILEEGTNYFGKLRGYAQQYLFYYARENKIGK